jgi:hypothetical protein
LSTELPKLSLGIVFLVEALVFVAAVGVSFLLGQNAFNGCLWAMLVSAIAGAGGFAPVILARLSGKQVSVEHVVGSSAIRLLLVIAGLVIMLFVTKTNMMWFAFWLAIFYVAMLVGEVYYAINAVNEQRTAK